MDEFTPDGQLVARVVNSGKKNAPLNAAWGLAMAPASFGVFAGDLLVGNFGNGRISAYQQRGATWVYKGQLRLADGTPIVVDDRRSRFGGRRGRRPGRDALLPGRTFGRAARAVRVDHLRLSRLPRRAAVGRHRRGRSVPGTASPLMQGLVLGGALRHGGRRLRVVLLEPVAQRCLLDRGRPRARVRSAFRRYGSRAAASCSCTCSTHFRWCCSAQSSSTQPRVMPFNACRVFG